VKLEAADAQGIVDILARAGAVAVEGDGKGGDFNFGHEVSL